MNEASRPPSASSGRHLEQLARIAVGELRGVGPRKSGALSAMGIETVLDLLLHYPRRYADRTKCVEISAVQVGEEAVISAKVRRVSTRRPRGRRAIVELVLDDGTGTLLVSFFNQPWRARQLAEGAGVVVFGRVDSFRSHLQMVNPIVDLVGDRTGRVVPIYPQSQKAGVSSAELTAYIEEALERAGEFADPLGERDRASLGLVSRTAAFRSIHAPQELAEHFPARRRLAFDELLRLQLSLVLRKRAAAEAARGIAHLVRPEPDADLVTAFVKGLPFSLTGAQRRVIAELAEDLASPLPMHRLLQGDVGSGKTVVALAALLYAVQGGHQGALMVPTEVLAEQHYLAARRLLAGLERPDPGRLGGTRPVAVALLTSRTTAADRRRLLTRLVRGELDLLVGTHALLTEDVRFASLGVVVIDEQHRFGVDQRAALREKGSADTTDGRDPDLLVMTATPIPRTAAMTVYGDLDYSVLDELPPSRTPVRTRWISERAGEAEAWERVRAALDAGRQAYVVCPLVRQGAVEEGAGEGLLYAREEEDSPDGQLFGEPEAEKAGRPPPRSAIEEHARLSEGELAGYSVGLLHGQLSSREKDKAMASFRDGLIQVLVATTVIEVGVDVANATVMVIEDADRFDIAQLHQLRGRVGRGEHASVCYLFAAEVTEDAARRLGALESLADGFELAEVDLELRGEGTVLGARQKGRSDLRLASLRRDRELILTARSVATSVIEVDPTLTEHRLFREELELFIGEGAAEYLERS